MADGSASIKGAPGTTTHGAPDGGVVLSVIAPAHDEEENVQRLVDEVGAAMQRAFPVDGAFPYEFIIADDASRDRTPEIVRELMRDRPWLRLVSLSKPESGGGNGQSAAFKAGFAAARGTWVATLDADLQNDPADLVRMLAIVRGEDTTHGPGVDFVQGDRSHARKDNIVRRYGSIVGRLFRRMLLGDSIRDTGCSLRVMRREIAVKLPLDFKGMHRFVPVTARQMGYRVVEMRVNHRPRHAGTPKYGLGITKRALPGLVDCFAVRWMRNRRRIPTRIDVIGPADLASGGGGPADGIHASGVSESTHGGSERA
ncbi:MAG: glycosyltransferase [Phycisphaerales bacterium]|nr:glycosyltransferase [Phycisphaerales bacterium]